MKGSAVLARTVWFVAISLLAGRPTFPHLTSNDVLRAAAGHAGAVINNAYIFTGKVATQEESVALNQAGRLIW